MIQRKTAFWFAAFASICALMMTVEPATAGGDFYANQNYSGPYGPLVKRVFKRRVVVEPGIYDVMRVPSHYGWRKRGPYSQHHRSRWADPHKERVLLRPYKNIAIFNPPLVDRYRERVKIYPESYVVEYHGAYK